MAAVPPRATRRRPRPGSLQRPINGRLYRGTWLLVALPLLLAAFSVARPAPLPPPNLPPAFDRLSALELTRDLALHYPNRVPGTAGATGAARWFREQLRPYGYKVVAERFRAHRSLPWAACVLKRSAWAVPHRKAHWAPARFRCDPRMASA